MNELAHNTGYQELLERISGTYAAGRSAAFKAVNTHLLETYWGVGRHIVEFEQGGKDRAEYGKGLIKRLSADLRLRHGKGFSHSNLVYMRQFYLTYPISQTASDLLSWSHHIELLMLDDPLERGFYEQQAIAERWSVLMPAPCDRRVPNGTAKTEARPIRVMKHVACKPAADPRTLPLSHPSTHSR